MTPTPEEAERDADERRALLQEAEQLWDDLQRDQLGMYSGINRPFWIVQAFRRVLEARTRERDEARAEVENLLEAAGSDAAYINSLLAAEADLLAAIGVKRGNDDWPEFMERVRSAIAASPDARAAERERIVALLSEDRGAHAVLVSSDNGPGKHIVNVAQIICRGLANYIAAHPAEPTAQDTALFDEALRASTTLVNEGELVEPAEPPAPQVLTFGTGQLVVNTCLYNGSPAVLIAPAKVPGEVGADAARENNPPDRLAAGEMALVFPTQDQVDRVADALVGTAAGPPAPPRERRVGEIWHGPFPLPNRRAADKEPAPQGDGWRPIETAPKDGTYVDLWEAVSGRRPDCFWSAADGLWKRKRASNNFVYELGCHFTHWRYPPAAPSDIEKGEG